jgi:hypothetical protein
MVVPMRLIRIFVLSGLVLCFPFADVFAQEKATSEGATQVTKGETTAEQIEKFSSAMKEVKFIGSFSVAGKDDQPMTREEYFILGADKLPEGDRWVITARIKYGANDLTVPMVMDVKWAGETPVITVDKLVIPGFGTFDARVIVHEGQYAGTWKHDDVGGHLIGRIEKLSPEELAELKKNIGRRKKSDKSNDSPKK